MRECEIDEFVQFLTEPIAEALSDYMAPDEFTDALMAVKSNIFARLQETAQRRYRQDHAVRLQVWRR